MRVLVTGATGYIGSVVAEKVAKAGHDVVAVARSDASLRALSRSGYEAHRADMLDAEALARLAASADATIHVANTQDASMATADPALVRAILAAYQGTPKRLVYTSGVWSYQNTGELVVDETTPPTDPLPLVAWRVPVEREVVAAGGVVVRPGIVYGRGEGARGILGMLVSEARREGRVRYVGDGRQEWPLVHVDDLADLYVRALAAPPGTLLHGVGDACATMRDLALAASHAGGAPGRVASWPIAEARAALGGFADALAVSQRVSSARTRAITGWSPRAPTVFEELLHGSYTRAKA